MAVAVRDIEAMHAIPWDRLGFAPTQPGFFLAFEGRSTVNVSDPMITPTASA